MTIEFKGALTGKCKKFLLMKQIMIQAIAALVVMVIFVPPIIVVSIHWKSIVLLLLIPIFLYVLVSLLPPGKNSQKIFMPKRVSIDTEEGTVVYQCEKSERFHLLEEIERVLDFGGWYEIHFKNTYRELFFCQKNLITQGTIEDFEKLFEDKIERRTNQD